MVVKYTNHPSSKMCPFDMENVAPFDNPDFSRREILKYALQPATLLRSVFASAIIWLIVASLVPSYSRLLFQGKLAGYFAAGLSIALVSDIVIVLVTSLFSSNHATLAVPQSPTVVIQGMIVSAAVAAAPSDMSQETLFATVVWIIVLSSVITGCFLLWLGLVRAGGLIRYVPYPIAGGFMAGLGWLLVQAGFSIVVDLKISVETLPTLAESAAYVRWLPAILFAIFVIGVQYRFKSVMILPVAIISTLVLFYVFIQLAGGSADLLAEAGWFLPPMPNTAEWQLPDLGAIRQIDSSMILASSGGILTLIVVCILNLFFKGSGQELIVGSELNFNRECAVSGIANMVSAVSGGGMAGYPTVVFASFVKTMGVYGRLVGVILALMFGMTLWIGGPFFALVPRFLPAGLLMYFGLRYMKEWLLESRFSLPRQDYIVIIVIALATALFGLLPGIAVGIMVAIAFFVLEYSRMDVIKQEISASIYRSNLERSFAQNQLLKEEGKTILILRLQGYVFFGTAYRFYEHIRSRILDGESDSLKFLILDFKSVRGFDVSAAVDFKKLKQLSDRHGIDMLISSVLPQLQPVLMEAEIVERVSGRPALFNDVDHALEWCENVLLEDANLLATTRITVEQQLAAHANIDAGDVGTLYIFLERMETEAGHTIFNQGDESDALYFIESGRVDVRLHLEADQELRLRSMTAGTVVGEIGFYLKKRRSASIVVTEAGVVYRLSHEALLQMETANPQLASAVHVFITCVLADRLSTTNQVIEQLMN